MALHFSDLARSATRFAKNVGLLSRANNCNLSIGQNNKNGRCITPLGLKAKAFYLAVINSAPLGKGPARLMSFNAVAAGSGKGGVDGPFGVHGLAAFDFGDVTAAANQYSEDNVSDEPLYYAGISQPRSTRTVIGPYGICWLPTH